MTTEKVAVSREDLQRVCDPDCYSFNQVRESRNRLRAALQQPAVEDWQPIETAPKDGSFALVYRPLAHMTNDENICVKRMIGGDNYCWDATVPAGELPKNPTNGSCHCTHWMPLPAKPSATKPAEAAQSMWTATIPADPKPSTIDASKVTPEQARAAFDSVSVRDQLREFVPPIGEWPAWAYAYVFKSPENEFGFVGDHWRGSDTDITFTREEITNATR